MVEIHHTASDSLIWVIDDEPLNLALLEDIIDERYQVNCLQSGEACLAAVEESRQGGALPDLILLDINMPGLSGFEVCQQLKANGLTAKIPVIFLTAMISVEEERHGLEVGAVDYITKPFTESILLARMQTHLALNTARKMVEQNNHKLRNERSHLEQIIRRMRDDDRFLADNLQQLVSPVEDSNGDIVLSASNRFHHQHILVGDFTGHGLTAAMAGPLVSSLFYTQNQQSTPGFGILELINNELYSKLPSQSFLASTFIDWDKNARSVTVWNFAMPDTVIIKANGDYQQIASMSVALGVLSCQDHAPQPTTISFEQGDCLFAYSDGIEDVQNPQGERFGSERLKALLKDIAQQNLSLDILNQQVHEFSAGVPIADDVTVIQLKANYA